MFRLLLVALAAVWLVDGLPVSGYPPSPAVVALYPVAPGRALHYPRGTKSPPTKTGHPGPTRQIAVVKAAINSRRWVEYVPQPSTIEETPLQVIEVDGYTSPVRILFRTHSAPVYLDQAYVPSLAQPVQHTRSEEQPQHLSHEVHKTLVQEVREVIKPVRRITTFIEPIQEEVRTVVSKSDGLKAEKPVTQQEDEDQQQQQQQQQSDGDVKSPPSGAGAPEIYAAPAVPTTSDPKP